MRPVVLAWWNRKLRNDPSAFLCFDSHSSNRYCPFSRREKSAQAKARVVVVSRFPRNTLVLDCSFKELPSTFLWLPNEGHRMIGLHRRTSYSGRTWGEYGSSLIALPQRPGPATWKTLAVHAVGFVSGRALPPEGINATPSPLAGQAASLADKVLVILGTKDEDCRLHRVHVSLWPAERNPVKFLFLIRKRPDESVGGKPYFANPKSSRGLAAPVARPHPTFSIGTSG